MNKLIAVAFSVITLLISAQTWAVTIAGIENITLLDINDTVSTSNHQFITAPLSSEPPEAGPVPANDPSIKEVLTDPFGLEPITWVLSVDSGAYIDINFQDDVRGADDLIFFFAGVVEKDTTNVLISFDLDINADGTIEDAGNNIVPFIPAPGYGAVDVEGTNSTLTAAIFDLDGLGLIASGQALNEFRIYLANNGNNPALAGVGYIAAIPLPLPIVLFASGLGALGLFARRKKL